MSSWLANTLLNTLDTISTIGSPPPPRPAQCRRDKGKPVVRPIDPFKSHKRKHTNDDSRSGSAKTQRYNDDAYRSSPFGDEKSAPASVSRLRGLTPARVDSTKPQTPAGRAGLLRGQVGRPVGGRVTSVAVAGSKVSVEKSSASSGPKNIASANLINAPNAFAHSAAKAGGDVQFAIWQVFQEPEYALRDVEVRDGVWHIQDMLEHLCNEFFAFEVPAQYTRLPQVFFEQFSAESARVVACVASGGPGGEMGWHSLFMDVGKRKAVVAAIVGNVLVEQVFQHMFFGGTKGNVEEILNVQVEHRDTDGFDRNRHHATYIRGVMERVNPDSFTLPENFDNHVVMIAGAIFTHLKPIWRLRPARDEAVNTCLLTRLHEIVTKAGVLSLSMRLDPHTVYHFEPVFKEDTFTSDRMLCFNNIEMEQTNPLTADTAERLTNGKFQRRRSVPAAERLRAIGDVALTQIAVMDGITAYRLGGWETPESIITEPVFERPEFSNRGVRSRELVQGWVYCRWGWARKFPQGEKADVPADHGLAWAGDRFINFSDVPGVRKWEALERVEREELRAMAKAEAAKENTIVLESEEEDQLVGLSGTKAPAKKHSKVVKTVTPIPRRDKGKGRAPRSVEAGSPSVRRWMENEPSVDTFETYHSPKTIVKYFSRAGASSRPAQDEQYLQDMLAAESSE